MATATGDGKKSQLSTTSSMESLLPSRRFEYREIKKATNKFKEVIGKGGYGNVYKGNFTNGSNVSVFAIKRLDILVVSKQEASKLLVEVERLSKLRHCNIVSLIGYCKDKGEMLLVYEYMPDGTLEDHLHKLGTPLTWLERLEICISAGRGLDYLHTGAEFAVLHGYVRSSNVFLHESCAAKISHFGLFDVVPMHQKDFSLDVNDTLIGYIDPEYMKTAKMTMKMDVYAFGVLLFEVLCRKPAVCPSGGEQRLLVTWAKMSILKGNTKDMIDSRIRGQVSPKCLKEYVRIAKRCLHTEPKERPTMAEVVVSLESVLALQEKMHSSQFPGQTKFGRMADMLPFSPNQQNSGGSYFRQNLKLSHAKSHGHTGDRGPMSGSMSEEWNARDIHLTNDIISELPDRPDCPILVNLFLHCNQDLSDIPITFFDNMSSLQLLDLSSTSLKCLPSSISKLTTLRKLFIRDCDLLMELPPEIGDLKNLKVFDSEGTQLVCLPEQFGSLTKLECLKFSLYNFADKYKRSNPSMQIIPATVLSKLIWLKELIIFVDLYGEWWEDEVKHIIKILPEFWNLESLRLYFPNTELLAIFMETQSWRRVPIYKHLSNFGFIVGHLQQRLISRVPLALHKTFVKLPKCLTYTNGEGGIDVIAMALTHANALFLDRHWTIRSLSAFGLAEMEKLKFCLLSECNKMLDIVNGNHLEDSSLTPVLGSLEHLSIHYMKSLVSIWYGPIHSRCLSNLKSLAIHSCPELRTLFTQGFLDSLNCLEYLIVEDCTTVKSLVSLTFNASTSTPCLPSLRKISLVHLPQLVSISHGIRIAPRLESLVIYDCPNLEELSYMEASDDLSEIKGENEWWDALKWCEPEWTSGQPDYLARVFTPLGTEGDIMDELADAVNLLPHLSY